MLRHRVCGILGRRRFPRRRRRWKSGFLAHLVLRTEGVAGSPMIWFGGGLVVHAGEVVDRYGVG